MAKPLIPTQTIKGDAAIRLHKQIESVKLTPAKQVELEKCIALSRAFYSDASERHSNRK